MSKETENNNIVPDFEFEVDSPIFGDESEEETKSEDTPKEEESEGKEYSIFDPLEKEEETKVESDDQYGENANSDVVAAYKFYRDNGIIENDYKDFDGSPEALQEILRQEDEQKYNQIYGYIVENSPDFAKPLLELVLTKGSELTPEEAGELFKLTKPSEVNPEDLKTDEGAEKYLVDYYMQTHGDTVEEAAERVDLLKDRGKLQKEAATVHGKEESVKEQLTKVKIERAKEDQKQVEARQQAFESTFVDSIKNSGWRTDLQREVAEEFYGGMFKKKMEHAYNNPKILPYLVLWSKFYDGKTFNADAFEKAIVSKQNLKRKNNIQNYWSTNVGSGGKKVDDAEQSIDLSDYEIEL